MDSLPNELVLEVLGYLSREGVHHALGISLVNRRFHELANEMIYSTFSVKRQDTALFMRTLASSSSLGRYVKYINWTEHITKHQQSFGKLTLADCRQLESRLAQLQGSTGAYGGFSRMSYLQDDLPLDTILFFTPRVESITVTLQTRHHRCVRFKPLALHPSLFNNLRKMTVNGPMRIWNVLPLFTVPSLRSLSLADIRIDRNQPRNLVEDGESYFSRLREEGSYIEHFRVASCYTDTKEIVELFGFFRSLKSFDFELLEGRSGPDEVVRFENLLQAILNQCQSLESLRLRDYRFMDASVLEVLKNLQHMRQLDLDISSFFRDHALIIEPDSLSSFLHRLPNTLRELTLKINDEDGREGYGPSINLAETLESLAPAFLGIFPALDKLVIAEWHPLLGIFPCQTQLKSLRHAFADADIDFVSRPHALMEADLYALNYIEEDWLWVQAIDSDGKWVRDVLNEHRVGNVEVLGVNVPDDWVEIRKARLGSVPEEEGLNEYTAEQAVWYWSVLHPGDVGSVLE